MTPPQVAVFTDTNLGTHIAVQVSQDIRAADFKGELKKAHFSCFPKHGIINIHALMVKQKSFFYHLPDSLLLRDVFRDIKGAWSISVNANSCCKNRVSREIRWMRRFPFRNILLLKKTKKKINKKKIKKKKNRIRNEEQREIDVIVSETEESSVSVSGIINKFFSDYNDMELEKSQKSYLRIRQRDWVYKTPTSRKVISKGRRSRAVVASCEDEDDVFSGKGIGKRILSASSNLRTKQKSGRKSKDPSIRNLVFEISDDDD